MKNFVKIAKFLEGIGSILNLCPQKNKCTISLPNSPIYKSLQSDWEKIGLDMWKAYRTIELQQEENTYKRINNDQLGKNSK